MRRDIGTIRFKEQTVVTIGNFDGVHLGHRALIAQTKEIAQAKQLQSTVLTFSPHPRVFFGDVSVGLITVDEEKALIFDRLGVDEVVFAEFNQHLARLTPEAFVDEILVQALNCRHVVIGENNYFGVNKSGDAKKMAQLCGQNDMGVTIVPPVCRGGSRISSERIRASLARGDIQSANAMLGDAYFIEEKVIHGKGLGRTLGFPTVNLAVHPQKLLPQNGVYLTRLAMGGQQHNGITNVGVRPTVSGVGISVETHILNFSGDCYGETARVAFLEQVREESNFGEVEQLKQQVTQDIRAAEAFFEGANET